MSESYTPREITKKINALNNGPKFDPYGSEALINRMNVTKAQKGDILAQAEQEQAKQKAAEQARQEAEQATREQKIAEAQEALENFTNYLSSYLNEQRIQSRLGDLEVNYDEATEPAMIARPDKQPFELDLSQCRLEGELPLPKQLLISKLRCHSNQLTSLPELPDSLTVLWCRDNLLTSLPELPQSLTRLYCSDNQLTSLLELPTSLTVLDCGSNQLTNLPELPTSLTGLDCSYNPLTEDAKQSILYEAKDRTGFRLRM